MKRSLSFAAAAAVLTAGTFVDAADAKSKYRGSKSYSIDGGKRIYAEPDRTGWYPRRADELKFGSKIWFEQMEAEGRFGGRRSAR